MSRTRRVRVGGAVVVALIATWATTTPAVEPTKVGESRATPSGLEYETLKEGRGDGAKKGQAVTIHETVTLEGGKEVFSTRDSGRAVTFTLGGGMVIAGIDEGVTGMKVGERRRLKIPPQLSKRKVYPEGLSPDATLFSEVELIGIRWPLQRAVPAEVAGTDGATGLPTRVVHEATNYETDAERGTPEGGHGPH